MNTMKKLFLLFLVCLFTFDFAEAATFTGGNQSAGNAAGLSRADDFASLLAKKRRKKKKKKSKKGKGKGGSDVKAAVGLGLVYNIPMGGFAKEDTSIGSPAVKGGIGFNIDGDYFLSPTLSVGVNTGYYGFKYDVADDSLIKYDKAKYSIIPLNLKASYYFSEGPLRPYVGINLGMNIISSNVTASVQSLYFNEVSGEMETIWLSTEVIDKMTKFGVAPMAGALYDVSDQLMLNFNLRYDYVNAKDKEYGFNNATFLGITFGAMFKF